jgi:hypothetical protein
VAPLETTVTPNSKDVREGGQEASPKRESGQPTTTTTTERDRSLVLVLDAIKRQGTLAVALNKAKQQRVLAEQPPQSRKTRH